MSEAKPFRIERRSVMEAYGRVMSNRGAGGVDEVSLDKFDKDYRDHLYRLWNWMRSGSYMPRPVKLVGTPKKGGGLRLLGIPTVADRIAQTVVRGQFEPSLELIFHRDSMAFGQRSQ